VNVSSRADPDPVLGNTMRRLRKERGATQEALAYKSGFSVGTWTRLEHNRSNATWTNVRKIILDGFGITFVEFAQALEETERLTADGGV
jgi:transcriptional regulator with XRE-family HTH domain